jgi:uncharacterized membrane protein
MSDLVRAGSSLGDAIAGHRTLGREDRTVLGTAAVLILLVAVVAGFFPWLVGWLVAVFAGWFGIVLGVRSLVQARRARRERELEPGEARELGSGEGRELEPGEGRELEPGE